MSARDGAKTITDKYGLPIVPDAHKHFKGTKATACCKRPCHCAAPKAFECQACSRDRRIKPAMESVRAKQSRVAGR